MRKPPDPRKLLANWSGRGKGYFCGCDNPDVHAARQHGAAAISAIRALDATTQDHDAAECALVFLSYRESRLAFRAALRACGITGAL